MGFTNTDTNLIGLWVCNDPSGSPSIRNHATLQGFNVRSSGVTLDMQLHVTDAHTNDESIWPGYISFGTPSGNIAGLQLVGSGFVSTDTNAVSSTRNVWLAGHGSASSRFYLATPSVANSGFTVGGWIYPNSSGARSTPDQLAVLALKHALISRFEATTVNTVPTHGFIIGVSGQLEFGAQNSQPDANRADRTLRLFAHVGNATLANHRHLATPIESGRFTHFTFTYTFVDGTSNTIDLYKDGILESSNTTASELDLSNSNYFRRALTLGGSESFSTANTLLDYTWSAGHNHIISGIYLFNRPLTASEVNDLHLGGAIGITTQLPSGRSTSITDSSLLGYYEFKGKGYADTSLKKAHLSTLEDSFSSQMVHIPGPFDAHAASHRETTVVAPLVAPSSISLGIGNSSWTIAGWFNANTISSYLWALGAEGSSSNRFATLDFQSAGITPRFTLYRDGTSGGSVVRLLPSGHDAQFLRSWFHAACVYNNTTFDAFLFIDGEQSASGNLGSALSSSGPFGGYPLVLLGSNTTDPITFSTSNGRDSSCANVAVFNRALDPFEIRGIALSGINTHIFDLTAHDPRLKAYWRCNEPSGSPMILDYSLYGGSGLSPGIKSHITTYYGTQSLALSFPSNLGTSNNKRLDFLSSIISEGGRGITSGIFVPMAGTAGEVLTGFTDSSQNLLRRFNLSSQNNATREQPTDSDISLYFEVTPSGSIPSTFTGIEGNSCLFSYGSDTGANPGGNQDGWVLYLTDCNRGPTSTSGTAIVWQTKNSTLTNFPLVSGNITPNVTNRVLIRSKAFHYSRGGDQASNPVQVELWINGTLFQRETYKNIASHITLTTGLTDYRFLIGGIGAPTDNVTQDSNQFGGLGLNSLKEIAFFEGTFTDYETTALATSGIHKNASLPTPEAAFPMTKVDINDPNLEGYWRFSDPSLTANSGLDSSNTQQNLVNFARLSPGTNAANILTAVQGPYKGYVNYNRQASGIGYPSTTNLPEIAPFMISGVPFETPQDSFSVGFWLLQNQDVLQSAQTESTIMAYGPYPSLNQSIPQDASWVVRTDSTPSKVSLAISHDGGFDFATPSGQNTVNTRTAAPQLQGWAHYIFSYNSNQKLARGYLNGQLVDQENVNVFHTPQVTHNKLISLIKAPIRPWTWDTINTAVANQMVMTDFFYFSRALDDSEARYIAASGIAFAESPAAQASGIIGGFITGFIPSASGTVGGWIRGSILTSGVAGGFINGGLSGIDSFDAWYKIDGAANQDFDSIIEIQRNSFYDFDAQVEIFQQRVPPLTIIEFPLTHQSGIALPYMEWFVASGVPVQGKTLTKATYNFGDNTPTINGIASGNFQYVGTHRYNASGLYITVFRTIDSDGVSNADMRIINLASGITLPSVELTATPTDGFAPLTVHFTTNITPAPGTTIISQLLDYGNGISTIRNNPVYTYPFPGLYIPVLRVIDSRGITVSDSLLIGANY